MTNKIYDGNWQCYTHFEAEQRQYWEGVVQRVKAQHPSARIEIRECAPHVKYPRSPNPCIANNDGYSSVWYDTTALDITAISKAAFGECSKQCDHCGAKLNDTSDHSESKISLGYYVTIEADLCVECMDKLARLVTGFVKKEQQDG